MASETSLATAIIIGGPPAIGKTFLAHQHCQQAQIERLINTDDVRHAVRSGNDLHGADAARFGSIGLFSASKDVREFFCSQAQEVCATVEKQVRHYASRGESIVVEGVHLLPTIEMQLSDICVVLRYVLTTPTVETYDALVMSRLCRRYGRQGAASRLSNYRIVWEIYAWPLGICVNDVQVLNAASESDLLLNI